MERIILALDGMSPEKAIETAKDFSGKEIWGFKINDLLAWTNPQEIIPALKKYGKIMVDPKIHDIPQTDVNFLKAYVEAGADFVTMHVSAGMDALLDAI